jgi:5-methylcytosine-specific restriction endonuclease McrA
MKKVEEFTGIDGVNRQWADIERLYYNDLFVVRGRYQPPLNKLQALLLDPAFEQDNERDLLNYLIENFENIIKAPPQGLYRIIQRFHENGWQDLLTQIDGNRLSPVGSEVLEAFSYERLRKEKLVNLAGYLNIKSCLYCNAQFTLVVHNGNKNLAKFQFDHFFPKKKYPYLSISLYNLIPSCASCNQCKTDRNYQFNEIAHPFRDDFQALTQFEINHNAHNRLLQGALVPENEINVYLSNMNDPRVRNQNSFTAIESIYKRHIDIVKEIYLKAYTYRNGGKEALMNLEHNGERLFASEDEIEWLLLANYKQVSDINKRPLAKFMQDIARQAGLIN